MAMTSYSLEFRGHATPLSPAVLVTRGSAPCDTYRDDGEALLEARVTLLNGDAFELAGTVAFGDGNALRFRSLGQGVIGPAPEAGMRLASAMCEIDGGAGELASAAGRITSSFLVSDTGELTEHQVGLVFVADAASSGRRSR
jgi:hypothetical protein